MMTPGITRLQRMMVAVLATCVSVACAEEGHEHGGEEAHGAHADEVRISAEAMAAFGVEVGIAEKATLPETTRVPARVEYNDEALAHVGSPVRGRAIELRVRLGDHVAPGDILAVIESPELGEAESDLLQKTSLAEAALGSVEVARIACARAEELRKTNSVSVSDLLARQGELKRAEGDRKVAEAARLAAENRLHILGLDHEKVGQLLKSGEVRSRYEVRAAIAGTVVRREVTPGEVVSPDGKPLFVLADLSTLWVVADVPERFAARVPTGTMGRIIVGSDPGVTLQGDVSFVAPELNPRTRTAQVRLLVSTRDLGDGAADPAIRPGMFAQVELPLSARGPAHEEPTLAVPEAAVQMVEGRTCVFVPADEPDTFTPRPLELGTRVGGFIPVRSGLEPGEHFVTKGSFLLKAELGKEGAGHEH